MANRPVFEATHSAPYFRAQNVDFVWSMGQNIKRQRMNVAALHAAYTAQFPAKRVLEISSRSLQPEGLPLSAFKLQKAVPGLGRTLAVENLYQGGKVFERGGPCLDLYDVPAMRAKKDERLHSLGHVTSFFYEGRTYPIEPYDAFYNWLYIQALIENPALSGPLLGYDAFTDLAYNPRTGTSCQARSAAIFVSLMSCGRIDAVSSFGSFVETVYGGG